MRKALGRALVGTGLLMNPLVIRVVLEALGRSPLGLYLDEAIMVGLVDLLFLTAGGAVLLRTGTLGAVLERAALLAWSCALTVFGVDIALQVIQSREISIVPSAEFHHDYLPNERGFNQNTVHEALAPVLIQTNRLAMRGPEPRPPAPDQSRRLLFLGDSFIQADELVYDSTMGGRLSALLGDSAVVMQHGMASWSPLLELNWLVRRWDDLQPTEVYLFLCINDFFQFDTRYGDPYYATQAVMGEDGVPERFEVRNGSAKLPGVVRWFTLPRVRGVIDQWRADRTASKQSRPLHQASVDRLLSAPPATLDSLLEEAVPGGPAGGLLAESIRLSRPDSLWSSETAADVQLTLHSLETLARFLNEHGAKLVVTMAPLGWEISDHESGEGKQLWGLDSGAVLPSAGLQEHIRLWAQTQGLEYMDLVPLLTDASESGSTPLYFKRDAHWTGYAHKLISDHIFQRINERKESDSKRASWSEPG